MARPGSRGGRGATAAVAVASLLLVPLPVGEATMGEVPIETWVRATCRGAQHCEIWDLSQRLSELLADRMEATEGERLKLAATIATEAQLARLDPLLVMAVIAVESSFDPEAVSHRGATGLMQLKPSTLRREVERARLGPGDLGDPVLNVRAGIRYLRRLLDDFRQDQALALMAYNAGPQRISRLRRGEGGVPDFYREYVRRVEVEHRRLRREGRARVAMAEAPDSALR